MKETNMYYTYILKCFDNSYYVGSTDDITKRIEDHNSGRGADFTAKRMPCVLVWTKKLDNRKQAINKEFEIKKFSRFKKEKLIFSANTIWKHYKGKEYIILGIIYNNMIVYAKLNKWSIFFYEKKKRGNQLAVWLRHKDQWLDWVEIHNQKMLRFSSII